MVVEELICDGCASAYGACYLNNEDPLYEFGTCMMCRKEKLVTPIENWSWKPETTIPDDICDIC